MIPKLRTLFVEQGAEPLVLGQEELRDFMASESAKWVAIMRATFTSRRLISAVADRQMPAELEAAHSPCRAWASLRAVLALL
jgi:hypothetical protein